MSFRICVIGCGGMSSSGHGPAYAKYAATHKDTELAACCDLVEEKAIRYRDRFGFARHYTDLADMLNREKPDAVCLIAPVHLTCELSCRVLEMGYPLLMEKPPGATTAELDRMIAAAEAQNVPTQVAFNRRYAPLVRELKRRLDGAAGPSGIHHVRYEMVRFKRKDPDFSTTAIHGIDAARFLAGSDYRRVRFHYQPVPEWGPTVVNIYVEGVFESGAAVHLSFCPVAGATLERAMIHASGQTFAMHFPVWKGHDGPGRLLLIGDGQIQLDATGNEISDGPEMFEQCGFYGETASFFDDLRTGRRPVGDLRNARQSVEIAQCLRERKEEYASRVR